MANKQVEDYTILRMALVGYQLEKQKINEKIAEIEARLKGKAAAGSSQIGKAKRVLSAAARARIAAAQRKRWAEHRKRAAASK